MNGQQSFDTATNPGLKPLEREEYKLGNGHMALLAVAAIMPLKDEAERYGGGVKDGDMFAEEAKAAIPWIQGISLRLVALKGRDHDGVTRELAKGIIMPTGDIHVELPYGHQSLTYYTRIDESRVASGWCRKYTGDKRKVVYSLPEGWLDLTPAQRYALWRDMIGGQFGFAPGQLSEGSTFYAYITFAKGKNDKWFTDVKKVYKDKNDVWMDACPTTIGTIDPRIIRAINDKITEGFTAAKSEETSFNFGANQKPSEDYDRVVGF